MDDDVQPGEVSTEGTTSEQVEAPAEQTLTPDVEQRIAEASELGRKAGMEQGRREMQSIKDTEVAQVLRQAREHQASLNAYKSGLGELDPETATRVELAELKARNQEYSKRDADEQAKAQFQRTVTDFEATTTDMLKGLGIDPDDKRIEWGDSSEPLMTKYQRISKKATEILKTDADSKVKKDEQKAKDLVMQERKEQGIDSPDTTQGAAVAPVAMPTADEIRAAMGYPAEEAKVEKRIEDFYATAKKATDLTDF